MKATTPIVIVNEASNYVVNGGKEEILADIDALVKRLKAMELKVKELM